MTDAATWEWSASQASARAPQLAPCWSRASSPRRPDGVGEELVGPLGSQRESRSGWGRGAASVLAGERATAEGRVSGVGDATVSAERPHVLVGVGLQQAVTVLHDPVAVDVEPLGGVERGGQLLGGDVAGTEGSATAADPDGFQPLEGLFDRRVVVRCVGEEQLNSTESEPLQAAGACPP